MSGREWKPGDVAMVCNEYGVWNVAICALSGTRLPQIAWRYGVADSWMSLAAEARPLLVIDPEDRDHLEPFWDALRDGRALRCRSNLETALRDFVNPMSRKPEEPTALGYVVTDRVGNKWVRAGGEAQDERPWRCATSGPYLGAWVAWCDLDAVEEQP